MVTKLLEWLRKPVKKKETATELICLQCRNRFSVENSMENDTEEQ